MASGLRAYNLGSLYAVGSEGMLVTCQAYLAKHPPPQLIVLCLSPENSQYPAADSPFALQFVRTYGRWFQHPSRAVRKWPWIDVETVREGSAIVADHLRASSQATLISATPSSRVFHVQTHILISQRGEAFSGVTTHCPRAPTHPATLASFQNTGCRFSRNGARVRGTLPGLSSADGSIFWSVSRRYEWTPGRRTSAT